MQKVFAILILAGLTVAKSVPDFPSSRFPAGQNRIIGGENAQPGDAPWTISLREYVDQPLTHICGGAIVAPDWIMTGGVCCNDGLPALFHATAGDVDILVEEGYEQHIQVVKVIQHPEYNGFTYENDICLMQLADNFVFNDYVSAVTLPEPFQQTEAGTIVTVTGYGSTNEGGSLPPEFLQKVDLPIVDDATCNEAYNSTGNAVAESMICAGDLENGGVDGCAGDSGGALCLQDTSIAIGLISWGRGCARPGFPGVNTEVSYFVKWINDTMSM